MNRRHDFSLFAAATLAALTIVSGCAPSAKKEPAIAVPDGFSVDTLYAPTLKGIGSWISLTSDDKGRLLASSEKGHIYRITPPPLGNDDDSTLVEQIEAEIGHAHGLLWAFNSLYTVVSTDSGLGGHNTGLYRLQDLDGDDQLETVELLSGFRVEAPEHGPHGIALGPDGKHIYLVAGNHTDLPQRYTSRISTSWGEDNLAPIIRDPRGHAARREAPGGWIARFDSAGHDWEMFAVGLRNPYDLVFNGAGDLFTFDSDMEWDFGLPWYRPIRFCFVPSGAEFGWRTGSGKWPDNFLDGVPPVLNIGQGSPTGLVSIRGGRFPVDYQNNLLLFDWSYGTIYRVKTERSGGGYTASAEPFLSGTPLPLTDGVIASDGALYFVTGGRSLTSYLFRTYYKESSDPVTPEPPTPESRLRARIEVDHTADGHSVATDSLAQLLGHSDRFVRYAARVALERRPPASWESSVLTQTDPHAVANGVAAIARTGRSIEIREAMAALGRLELSAASNDALLEVLRAYSLLRIRFGEPTEVDRRHAVEQLSPLFPVGDDAVDRELCRLLVFLDDPSMPERTVPLLKAAGDAEPQQERGVSRTVTDNTAYADQLNEMLRAGVMAQSVSYAQSLSHATEGWNEHLRKRYFDWFREAMDYQGGPSYRNYLDLIRGTAISHVPPDERADLIGEPMVSGEPLPRPEGPGRTWTSLDVRDAWSLASNEPRDLEHGYRMYRAALCESCHAVRGIGGNIGPDLTKAWTRFSIPDLVAAIVTPSAYIPERYATTILRLTDQSTKSGLVLREDDQVVVLNRNVFDVTDTVQVAKSDIMSREHSNVSIMPSGLLNTLNPKEMLDLLAFIRAEGVIEK